MAMELAKACENLNLSGREKKLLTLDDEENELTKKQMNLRLVGKLLINKPFSKAAMKNTLTLVWKPQHGLAIREVESNLFVFQFFSETDKQKVIHGMPWTFDDYLVLLKEFDSIEKPSEVAFNDSPMWVEVYDIPLRRRNRRTAETIGNHVGKFLDFDDSDILGLDRTLKIKVLLDINKPLLRGITIDVGGVPKWVDIKYIRLPIMCFNCGILGHVKKECPGFEDKEIKKNVGDQYGVWMCASPFKPGLKQSNEEREKEKTWMMKMEERGREK